MRGNPEEGKRKWKMYNVWMILAILCLAYYIRCAAYAGIGSSFIYIWLMGAAIFIGIFVIRYMEVHQGLVINLWLRRGFVAVFALGLTLFLLLEGMIIANMFAKGDADCQYMVVLGCQIRGDHITKSLQKRLDTALAYAKENEQVKIIVSGGQGPDENTSEAFAMQKFLVENGITQERIAMEDQSRNTEENLRFSMAYIENPDAKVAVVSSNFHILRATLIAKAKGLNNVCGIASPSDDILVYNYMVRESLGLVKDFLVGNFSR